MRNIVREKKKTVVMATLQRLLRLAMVMIKSKSQEIEMLGYNPMIIPKRKSLFEGLEYIIVSLYVKGISVSDIEEQIRKVYNFDVSRATNSHITDAVTADIVAWQN